MAGCLTQSVEFEPISGETQFDRIIAEAQQLEESVILEMDTYMYHGHSISDPGSTYHTRDQISSEHDPVGRIRKLVLSHDLATEKELKLFKSVVCTVEADQSWKLYAPVPWLTVIAYTEQLKYLSSVIHLFSNA
ncbi:Pyruvate dehydrogenase E1 component subunit alpha mitochondrial-like [Forsythia ovata]|uniref:Pyruvate dehydrogenase E1 component subunit alpha mitochondrial-like n=1 Tax=Forsythia ovata TaxID=205694 RepID=A0ABD1S6C1_9LAMI